MRRPGRGGLVKIPLAVPMEKCSHGAGAPQWRTAVVYQDDLWLVCLACGERTPTAQR